VPQISQDATKTSGQSSKIFTSSKPSAQAYFPFPIIPIPLQKPPFSPPSYAAPDLLGYLAPAPPSTIHLVLAQQFDQYSLSIPETEEFKELRNLFKSYNGICEIVGNYILISEMKRKGGGLLSVGNLSSFCLVKELNNPLVLGSHCFAVYTDSDKLILFLSNDEHSDRVFSIINKSGDITCSDFDLFGKKLKDYNVGKIFKALFYQTRGSVFFEGHSILIMKSEENQFIVFDPNAGRYLKMSFDGLCVLLERCSMRYNNLVVLDGDNYFLKIIDHNP